MATTMAPDVNANSRAWQPEQIRWQRDRSPMILIPKEVLDRYVSVGLRAAFPQQTDDGKWYCALDRFPGVWAEGGSPKECLDTLDEVLREWVLLKIAHGDTDIPVVDEIDLTAISWRR